MKNITASLTNLSFYNWYYYTQKNDFTLKY